MLNQPIILKEDVLLEWIGPPLHEGPLPALIYLAISAKDSLTLDPFNQPVEFLKAHYAMRVFSLTLPAHEPPLEPQHALKEWADAFVKGHDLLSPFIDQLVEAGKFLVQKEIASSLGVAGLSRGGFLALHAAAKSSLFSSVLGFAPVTKLENSKDFRAIPTLPILHGLRLELYYSMLIERKIRLYIGSRDERVSTASCFDFIEKLADKAHQMHKRASPHAELIISPSIGYLGHGTPLHIFQDGARWMAQTLGASPKGKSIDL